MPADYRASRYPCVFWRGDVLYYTVRSDGRKKQVKYGYGDPRDAAKAQQAAQARADRIAAGVEDPRQQAIEAEARRPLADLIEDYKHHLESKGDSKDHVKNTKRYIERWAAACSIARVIDATPHATNRWLKDLGRSARTRNLARASVVGFCRWAADYGKAPRNPCPAGLIHRADEDADRRRLSRALTPEQFEAILGVAKEKRAAFYLLAANTGLRWREIARLTWGMVDLDAALVIVPAGQTKNKKQAELPLVEVVVKKLAAIRSTDAAPNDRVFAHAPRLRTWMGDLARAGLWRPYCDLKTRQINEVKGYEYVDERGRRFDRKCLRMSFATWLKRAGVDLRDAQRLMRHSDPKLTANIYTDTRLVDLRRAVERIGQASATSARQSKAG